MGILDFLTVSRGSTVNVDCGYCSTLHVVEFEHTLSFWLQDLAVGAHLLLDSCEVSSASPIILKKDGHSLVPLMYSLTHLRDLYE